ncbi:hypothetical protein GCM10022268_18410 [Sphingomonas cynarae]|uniref:Integrase catalytic domain-containing protein n=1 Tax=Sphingomonas cynarae TaxID=930197 RepID=A0ABP7DS90_9SPHN
MDISYVWTREGWLYLAAVIDLFFRRVIGWAIGDRLHHDLALAAWHAVIAGVYSTGASSAGVSTVMSSSFSTAACIDRRNAGTSSAELCVSGLSSPAMVSSVAN